MNTAQLRSLAWDEQEAGDYKAACLHYTEAASAYPSHSAFSASGLVDIAHLKARAKKCAELALSQLPKD